MTRLLTAAALLVSVGCSNAPIAGSLDAIWPGGHGSSPKDRGGNTDRLPPVPDVRPPGPDTPRLPPGPAPSDALPPPADFVPSGSGVKG